MSEPVELRSTRLAEGITFGEGPRWHDGRLWFSDGPTGTVKSVDDRGRVTVELEAEHPSGLGWLPDGRLVLCTMHAAKILRADPDGVRTIHDLGHLAWSTNDMCVTTEGRIYVDLYRRTDTDIGIVGDIGLISPDGEVRVVAADLAVPNGISVMPDAATLVVGETFGSRLTAFTIAADGGLTDRRLFADLGSRHPDGICVDVEGGVWVGCYDTNEFLRVLEGGTITHRVEVEGGWAVAPALGGPDRRTLFLIVNDSSHEKLPLGESVGRIDQVRVDVPGLA